MDKQLKYRLVQEKRAFEILGLSYLNAQDKQNANYISNQILGLETRGIVVRNTMSLTETFLKSAHNMEIFGNEFSNRAMSFASTNFIPFFNDAISFMTNITFEVDDSTKKIDYKSGKVNHFKIPQQIDDTSGDVFLTHEFIHGIKDTNYKEYVNLALADVIPLFYELIHFSQDSDLKKDFLNIRMNLLKINRLEYISSSSFIKNSKNERDLYKIIQTRTGEYLNSFYYSLVLYNIYRSNPNLVLKEIKKVLNHEITTLDMLQELGIYNENLNSVVDEEITGIRRILN